MPNEPDRAQNRLDRLERVVESLAASVIHRDNQIEAHDRQIGALIEVAARHDKRIEQLIRISEENRRDWEQLRREFEAYLRTIHPKQ